MTVKEFFSIVIEILKNWCVIATLVTMLFVIGFSNFVIKYRRKPKKGKKKGTVSSAPAAAPAPEMAPPEGTAE